MTINFTCQKCDSAFDIEANDIIDGTEKIECPHCHAKPSAAVYEDFASALGELATQVNALSRKFLVSFTVDSEEIAAAEEEEEEEDEEEDDDDEETEGDEDDDDEADDEADEERY